MGRRSFLLGQEREHCEDVWKGELPRLEFTFASVSSTISEQERRECQIRKGEYLCGWTSPSTHCCNLSTGTVSQWRTVKKLRVNSGRCCQRHSASTSWKPAH